MKILQILHCLACKHNRHNPEVKKTGIIFYRFRCYNEDSKRKNGEYRIINKRLVTKGKIPGWCKLEDYKKQWTAKNGANGI